MQRRPHLQHPRHFMGGCIMYSDASDDAQYLANNQPIPSQWNGSRRSTLYSSQRSSTIFVALKSAEEYQKFIGLESSPLEGSTMSRKAWLPRVTPKMLWARYCSWTRWQGITVQYCTHLQSRTLSPRLLAWLLLTKCRQ